MEESKRILNPYVLHLQKLSLELKCPLCLEFFKRPIVLPCAHIFCFSCVSKSVQIESECPACNHTYFDREVKPATFMENIVNIYRNLDSAFNANLIHPVCSDVGTVLTKCPALFKTDGNNSSRNEGNSSNGLSAVLQIDNGSVKGLVNKKSEKCITPESSQKQEFNNSVETGVSPQLSNDSKVIDGDCSEPNINNRNSGKCSPKRSAENVANPELNSRSTPGRKSQTSKGKRLKITDDGGQSAVLEQLNSKMSCAFCHSKDSEGSGPLISYARGRKVTGNVADFTNIIHVHEKCVQWAPRIYFPDDGTIKNLESEIARANKLKCSSCLKKGAALGCYMSQCKRTYHVPCAYDTECKWETDGYLLMCPQHKSCKFPNEQKMSKAGKQDIEKGMSTSLNPCTKSFVFCGSALSSAEKCSLHEFARTKRSVVSKYWSEKVTHVIAATDSNGACTRTFKVLMAILNGKWILTVEWVKACLEAGKFVNEEPYEVHLDTHGCSGGPKAGRLRVLNNAPKLFNNMKFYFVGDFSSAFKTDLVNLVMTAGGEIATTKDQLRLSRDEDVKVNVTLVVYNADLSKCYEFEDEDTVKFQRLAAAEDVAQAFGSMIVGHTWILESIAACRLVPYTSRA